MKIRLTRIGAGRYQTRIHGNWIDIRGGRGLWLIKKPRGGMIAICYTLKQVRTILNDVQKHPQDYGLQS